MTSRTSAEELKVGFAQIAPVWLDRQATLFKVVAAIHEAADEGAQHLGEGGDAHAAGAAPRRA